MRICLEGFGGAIYGERKQCRLKALSIMGKNYSSSKYIRRRFYAESQGAHDETLTLLYKLTEEVYFMLHILLYCNKE